MGRIVKFVLLPALLVLLLVTQAFAVLPEQLVPGGEAIGLEVKLQGVLVLRFCGENTAAERAGLKPGDCIMQVDGVPLNTVTELIHAVQSTPSATLTVQRDAQTLTLPVTPEQGKLGICVRDALAGVGTVSFYDPQTGCYGALGHGINEPSSGSLLRLREGNATQVVIESVRKGVCGKPGELRGKLLRARSWGTIEENTAHGIFGQTAKSGGQPLLPVAQSWEIETGDAEILSTVAGQEPARYTVEIETLRPWDANGKNLTLVITDPALLAQTGGIVQGMSGSPILQNGKLVGAVTHVFVNDPTRGYGIFIRNYLSEYDRYNAK